jgi:hypothetical protein
VFVNPAHFCPENAQLVYITNVDLFFFCTEQKVQGLQTQLILEYLIIYAKFLQKFKYCIKDYIFVANVFDLTNRPL